MSHDSYKIELFCSPDELKLHQEGVLAVVRQLPVPVGAYLILRRDGRSKMAQSNVHLNQPTRELVNELLSGPEFYKDFSSGHFDFEDSKRGSVHVAIAPDGNEEACELFGDMASELKKRRMQAWRQVAVVTHGRGHEGELDRRVFDYGKLVATSLIPTGKENQYALFLTDGKENVDINSKQEFFGKFESLVRRNCQ